MDCDHKGALEVKNGRTYCKQCGEDVTNSCIACKLTEEITPEIEPCTTCMIG